jgi:ABC-2 type transport system permease protein
MRNIWTITTREYKSYFKSPIAYATAFFFLGLIGYLFFRDLAYAYLQGGTPGVQTILGRLVTFLIFTMPSITMRTLSEEYRMGTIELLLTSPIRDSELVIGKWLGGFLFVISLVFVTLIYSVILNNLIEPGIDQGILTSGYLGLILMVSALMAIGVMISSFTSNQIVAFIISLFLVLFLWFFQPSSNSSQGELSRYINFIQHYMNFYRGTIDLSDVVYYLSLTSLGLFIGTLRVEARRWG